MIECKTCRSNFLPTKDRKLFCSHPCQARWAVRLSLGRPRPGSKRGKEVYCIVCSGVFYVPRYRLKKGNVKYCSRKCLAKNHLKEYIKIHGFQKTNKPLHKYKTIRVDGKSVRFHRWVMEQYLGRKLERWEHVHHINDDSSDNRLENLEVLSNSDHQRKEYIVKKKSTS